MLVGSSFGGWIALEMCVRSVERIGRLVLIDSLGVKFGGREERDIADIYALPAEEVLRRTFADPARFVPDYARLDDAELLAIARDREATALYGWSPYMHDPALGAWLHRVTRPALVLWGEHDGIVAPQFGGASRRGPTQRPVRARRRRGALSADRAARRGRRPDRGFRAGGAGDDACLAFQRDGVPPGLAGSARFVPRRRFRAGSTTRKSAPISTTAISTNGRCATSSASTS